MNDTTTARPEVKLLKHPLKAARNALFKTQKRPSVIAAFWVQAELILE